jgi:P-type Ca2+ transporter type 2C
MGTGRLAQRRAIVKRLASVETLGGTSQICTDKTGTLTLNQMTAKKVVQAGRRFTVSGESYSTEGWIRVTDGQSPPGTLDEALIAMGLCSDAVLRDGEVVGDPTEGALAVLAEKGGIDVAALREDRPRVAEVAFESADKFMATFHRWTGGDRHELVRGVIKGAPDVLATRADRYLAGEEIRPFDEAALARYDRANASMAERGMRVLTPGYGGIAARRPERRCHPLSHLWTIATGHREWCSTDWLTDPSSRPVKPPRPRAPTTISCAWSDSSTSALAGRLR